MELHKEDLRTIAADAEREADDRRAAELTNMLIQHRLSQSQADPDNLSEAEWTEDDGSQASVATGATSGTNMCAASADRRQASGRGPSRSRGGRERTPTRQNSRKRSRSH